MQAWLRYTLLATTTVAATAHWVPGTDTIPAFYAIAPHRAAHPLLAGDQLTGPNFQHQYQVVVYEMAAKVENVLYYQPCYCRCDRALQHKSLHSCFEGTHGAECATCMREGIFTYQQTKLGKTPQQIRQAIEHGDAQSVDIMSATL